MSAIMHGFAEYVVEHLDDDGEFYSQESLGDQVLAELIDRGYLIRCDACQENGFPNVYYQSDADCPNLDAHHQECGDCGECVTCGECSCEEKEEQEAEIDAAWA